MAGLSLSACTIDINTVVPTHNSNKEITEYTIETAMHNIYTKTRSEDLSTVMYGLKMAKEFIVIPKGTTCTQ